MKKHANKTTLAVKTIKIIRSGATWQEVSELLDYSIVYLQRLCKTYFKRPENYRKLLELAQSNKKAKKEAKQRKAEIKAQKVNQTPATKSTKNKATNKSSNKKSTQEKSEESQDQNSSNNSSK